VGQKLKNQDLTPLEVRRWCEASFVSAELTAMILAAAERIAASEELSAMARRCHEALFGAGERKAKPRDWPVPLQAMGDLAGMFYVVVLLSGTPLRQAVHAARGIPDEIVRETVTDLELCIRTERQDELKGLPGITGYILGWLLLHWRGDLYRLGRLQFVPGTFRCKVRAFRNAGTGVVVALSDDGVRYRADGQVDGAGKVFDAQGAWTAEFRETGEAFVGSPISPEGHALRRVVQLAKAEWLPALAPGDPVLEIHMPAGPPMAFDACGDSIRRALEFFPRYFPDRPFVGFACTSWLLDAQLDRLRPPTSNLVRFQKEMYLFPIGGASGEMPWQVKVRKDPKTGQAAAMTTMQRAFYRHVEQGGRFYNGGCFLLKEDFRWGGSVYRSQSVPW